MSGKRIPHRQEIQLEYKGHRIYISPTLSRQGSEFVPCWKTGWRRLHASLINIKRSDYAVHPFSSVRAAMQYSKDKIDESLIRGSESKNADGE